MKWLSYILFLVSACFLTAIMREKSIYRDSSKAAFPVKTSGREKNEIQAQTRPDMSSLAGNIKDSEYHIRWKEEQQCYSSPNREQNLRISYHPDGFSLELRQKELHRQGSDRNEVIKDRSDIIPLAGFEFQLAVSAYGKGRSLSSFCALRESVDLNEYIAEDNQFRMQCINQQEGLRQNFYVLQQPQGTGDLRINLHAKGLEIRADSSHVIFFNNENRLTYADLKVWDARGDTLNAYFSDSGNNTFAIVVNDADALYPITVDPIITSGSVIHANAVIEGNSDYYVLGNNIANAGDVNGDGFGDVVVGVPHYDGGVSNGGAAFVYYGTPSGFSTAGRAIVESNYPDSYMGISVSGAGDINNDGYDDIIVGGEGYSHGESLEGAVFVYYGSAKGVDSGNRSVVESNQINANFGRSVSAAGDLNSDGYSDVIIGAPNYMGKGAVFIYHGSGSGLSNIPSAFVQCDQDNAGMGTSVASAGDINGDGHKDVMAGAFKYDNEQEDEGVVFIFYGSAGGINMNHASILECNQDSASFGIAISSGDFNGDGYSDIIAGATTYDHGEQNEGAAFIYYGSSGGIKASPALLEKDQQYSGMGVAFSKGGDVDGDGYEDVVVGACYYDHGEEDEGAAFVYYGSGKGIVDSSSTMLECDQPSSFFGGAVAILDDANKDGFGDIVAGAAFYSNEQTFEGAFFLYNGSASASMRGTVHAGKGYMQSGTVVATHQLTGKTYYTTVNSQGEFIFNYIPAGSYFLKAEPSGGSFQATYHPNSTNINFADTLILKDSIWGIDIDLELAADVDTRKPEISVQAFPNPFSNELNIKQGKDIEVSDITGIIVWQDKTEDPFINTSAWKPGVYFVRSGKGTVIKVVKVP